jgi:hypothetical protein
VLENINAQLAEIESIREATLRATMRTSVFVSYAHADSEYLEELRPFLDMTSNIEPEIMCWNDSQLNPGDRWKEEIKNAISRAKIFVLLGSANFFASKFIKKNELPPILKAAEESGAHILWLPVRRFDYGGTCLKDYQAVSNPEEPISKLRAQEKEDRIEEIYTELSKRIRTLYEEQNDNE